MNKSILELGETRFELGLGMKKFPPSIKFLRSRRKLTVLGSDVAGGEKKLDGGGGGGNMLLGLSTSPVL